MKNSIVPVAFAMYASLCLSAACQSPTPFSLWDLGSGAWAAIDNSATKPDLAGSNAGFVIGPDAVLVADTFVSSAAAQKMLEAIRDKTNLPVRYVVNTHYHLDHVAGNEVFAKSGATVMAHDNVRFWMRTENLKFFGEKITPKQREWVDSLYLPDVTYARGATVYVGINRNEVLRFMPGHTGGDTIIYDAQANVVFCGDLFWNHALPNLIDASTKEWVETLNVLLQDYPTAKFVPGHGEKVGDASDVRAFRDYLLFLRQAVSRAQADGASGANVLKVVLPQVSESYGKWAFFDFAGPGIKQTDEELRHIKKLPQRPLK
jgi:glyoxylase-like metal-dependent hydrolase (beta-lactamase superfamily II)